MARLLRLLKPVHDQTLSNLTASTSHYKVATDTHCQRLVFNDGDLVWAVLTRDRMPAHLYNKLRAKKIGPLKILEHINDNAYRLELPMTSTLQMCSTLSISPHFFQRTTITIRGRIL